jgi:hypothetical protein
MSQAPNLALLRTHPAAAFSLLSWACSAGRVR